MHETVGVSTVPRLSLLSGQCCRFGVGKRTLCGGGRAVSLTPTWPATRSPAPAAFTRDQMTGSNDVAFRWLSALWMWWAVLTFLRKQHPERPPRTLQNTAMAVLSGVANHRAGSESSVVVTILHTFHIMSTIICYPLNTYGNYLEYMTLNVYNTEYWSTYTDIFQNSLMQHRVSTNCFS